MNTIQQPSFDTVTEALQWLNSEGFSHDFNLDEDRIHFNNNSQVMSPNEFNIEYIFRFEGETDPGDEDIVYGIASTIYGIKGVLTSAFGIYADSLSADMIKKLSVR
jgi:hypothetical protein